MGKRTALYERHLALGAKIVDFAGWDMPVHYGSQVEEHHAVRRAAGMFDVSHMTVVDVSGPDAPSFLRRLLANDIHRLQQAGHALYGCMLNPRGGIIDDLIVYRQGHERFRMVVNAATREKDLTWMEAQSESLHVTLQERLDLAMIAVQGPQARSLALPLLDPELRRAVGELEPFKTAWSGETFVARTGYTGEDGLEVMLPNEEADAFVVQLHGAGVKAAGLGARDTLRLEAGMNLYGTDMDESVTPLESGLGWTVAWRPQERAFIGRESLEAQKRDGVTRVLVGLLLEGPGVMRNHQRVVTGEEGEGEITSGGFSPTLGRSIAFARVPAGTQGTVRVEIRGRLAPARVVKPPFVRHGVPRIPL